MPPSAGSRLSYSQSKIQHIVIVIQENRTVDNLFHGFPGADTVKSGENSHGEMVPLSAEPLSAPYSVGHSHDAFKIDYADGRVNGFNIAPSWCDPGALVGHCPPKEVRPYGYVPKDETKPYWQMARQYAFADEMFQTNQGPSFPAHQYIVSGTSAVSEYSTLKAAENPDNHRGCGAPRHTRVRTIDSEGKEKVLVYPCFDRESIFTLLDAHGISWRYYKIDPMYDAVDALKPIWDSSEYATNVISPPSQFLRDVNSGVLAEVTFVTPTAKASDHAGITDGTGPAWVASVVNAVGESQFWTSTAIFLMWDDWGGWYDHQSPKIYNSYELGFRVPLIVISPYAKAGFVSHKHYEFGSILKFIEKTGGLGSLGTTDARANDPSNMFDFSQKRIKFKQIQAPLGEQYFLHEPIDNTPVDDD